LTFSTRHDNDNLTIQAVTTHWFVDVAVWHTSYGNATPTFHKYIEVVICRLVWLQRNSQYSLLHHNCSCPFVKHNQQKQCLRQCNLRNLQ